MERNEAIDRLRQLYLDATDENKAALEALIPELKESEDERIRKWLSDILDESNWRKDWPYTKQQVINYLEKQKELFESGRGLYYYDGEKTTYCGYPATEENPYDFAISQQEKQKEQKPAEWRDEYREEDLRTRFAFYTYKDEDSVLYLSNVFVEETSRNKGFGTKIKILQAAENVAETIGATAIRLKVKRNFPVVDWYRKHGYEYLAFEGKYDWLEKRLEYLKPKQEWSEEDEKMIRTAVESCKTTAEDYENSNGRFYKCIDWLKSLPSHFKSCCSQHMKTDACGFPIREKEETACGYLERCLAPDMRHVWYEACDEIKKAIHLNSWKPSEEQMRAVFDASERNDKLGSVLSTLYNDLKKL